MTVLQQRIRGSEETVENFDAIVRYLKEFIPSFTDEIQM